MSDEACVQSYRLKPALRGCDVKANMGGWYVYIVLSVTNSPLAADSYLFSFRCRILVK